MIRRLFFVLVLFFSISTSFTQSFTIGIIGTFSNWATDVNMSSTDGLNWTLNYTFSAAEQVKFRKDALWTVNWGASTFPTGTGFQDGPNIPVSAGSYLISFNSTTGAYNFQLQNPNPGSSINPTNRQIVLQGFWWDYFNANYPDGWANYLAELAPRLKNLGIDAIWIPPTIKNTGTNSVGYAPFDHYDLGDKWQKNSVKTRLGDKDELLRMMAVMKANGIDVIQDIVLNHITGAGGGSSAGGQDPSAIDDGQTNRYKNFRYACYSTPAQNETSGNYLARQGRFPKNWHNFYPNANNPCCTNDINSPFWGPDISYESNSFGLSSNATFNPQQTSDYMRIGIRDWLIWYKKQMGWDGVRIDAVKHFPAYVSEDVLWNLQNNAAWASGSSDMFAVGEWVGGITEMDGWANSVLNRAGTFDFSLRGALQGMVQGNGNYNIGSIPSSQQTNRQRTVPFVNNHDTFRPQLSSQGNYIGWNSALGTQIEPNDGRNSAAHAIAMAVDGAPQIFLEDLFNIGYQGNRFNHEPKIDSTLPTRSDIENIIWCHQNLRFKEGAYLVRWQAADALVIERQNKAIIAATDSWTVWQNLTGVQTSWSDGTVLMDYSGANSGTRTVYGGGKVDISIPPCDGTAILGRRGYSIWAPLGITTNYVRPAKSITQEWEMENDLGDRHLNSLEQGGRLPDNSLDCRTVGRIFADSGSTITLSVFPSEILLGIRVSLLDNNCLLLDSATGTGEFTQTFQAPYAGWYTMRVQNATSTQLGQKCWVKANYTAPQSVETNVTKNKCACVSTVGLNEIPDNNLLSLFPNPANTSIELNLSSEGEFTWELLSLSGSTVKSGKSSQNTLQISLEEIENGTYFIRVNQENQVFLKKLVILKD
jgi:alpha-amylase